MINKEELKEFIDFLIEMKDYDFDSFGAGFKMLYVSDKIYDRLDQFNSNKIVKEKEVLEND